MVWFLYDVWQNKPRLRWIACPIDKRSKWYIPPPYTYSIVLVHSNPIC